jgi:hypothetical protein
MGKKWVSATVLFASLTVAFAADRAPSTPADRARLVKAAELMQKKPLSADAIREGRWALQWITDVPDVNVTICGSLSPHYKYEGQMMASDVLSMGAFIIRNPKKASDQKAVWRAGVDGMLQTYTAILDKNYAARDDVYDDLLEQRSQDDLMQFMNEYGLRCFSSSGAYSRI